MKSEKEIQELHDILENMLELCSAVPMEFEDEESIGVHSAKIVRCTLCWILGHEGGINIEHLKLFTEACLMKIGQLKGTIEELLNEKTPKNKKPKVH